MQKLKNIMARSFADIAAIDPRALALFRISLGFVLLLDLINKTADLTAFYTDRGIFSRTLAIQDLGWWSFSFHMASGTFGFQLLLMILGIGLSLALILGYQTRLVTGLLWAFFVSLHNRNYLILHSGDNLIRVLLFWAMFLPLEARYSWDRLILGMESKYLHTRRILSLASFAILAQVLFVYFCTALLKNHPDWNKDYLAIYYAMNLEQFTTPTGRLLLDFPKLMKALTAGTFLLELLGPVLLIIPLAQKQIRSYVPFAFMALHLGLFITMNLGLFPWICIAAWTLFLPAHQMDFFENQVLSRFKNYTAALARLLTTSAVHLPRTMVWQRHRWLHHLGTAFLAVSLFGMSLWNILKLPQVNHPLPATIEALILPLRLDQYWGMFAPYPMRNDGWYVVEGQLKDGSTFDTWNHQPVSWEKPADFFASYRSTPWRKYLTNAWADNSSNDLRLAFGRFVCREWNDLPTPRTDDKILLSYRLYYMLKITPLPGEISKIEKRELWSHSCFDNLLPAQEDIPPPIKN